MEYIYPFSLVCFVVFLYELLTLLYKVYRINIIQTDLINLLNNAIELLDKKKSDYPFNSFITNEDKNIILREKINKELYNKAIYHAPEIRDLSYFDIYNRMKFDNSMLDNITYASKALDELKTSITEYRYQIKKLFYPTTVIKKVLSIPSTLISLLGFSLNIKSQRIINLLGYILFFIFEVFNAEVTNLLQSLFR